MRLPAKKLIALEWPPVQPCHHIAPEATAIKLALFDIDGTICNCMNAGRESLVRACLDVFGTIGAIRRVDFQGKTDPLILRESLEVMGFSRESIREKTPALKERYFGYLEEFMASSGAVLLPGIGEILERLNSTEGVLVGLLTGNFQRSARIKLDHFGLNRYFPFGVFGDDADLRDDMPPIAQALARHRYGVNIPFGDIYVIGDTVYDILCARASGAVSISVGTGWVKKDILLEREPDHFFDDLSDTAGVLGAMGLS